MAQDSKTRRTVLSSSRRSGIKQTSATLTRWIRNILSFCYINKEKKQTRSGVRHKSNVDADSSCSGIKHTRSSVESNVNEFNINEKSGLFINKENKRLDQEREDLRPRMDAAWIKELPGKIIKHIESYLGSHEWESLLNFLWNFCNHNPPKPEHVERFCLQFRKQCHLKFQEYLYRGVDSLREKDDDLSLTKELAGRWSNHKVMFEWLSKVFNCLNPNSIPLPAGQRLNEIRVSCFRDVVYTEFSGKVRDAVISLINKEREGEQIDQALLKNVLDIFVEIGMWDKYCKDEMKYYKDDFEASMLNDTASYYSSKASVWMEGSWRNYMIKAEECLKKEKDRVEHYLHSSSEPKLLERVQHELLTVNAAQLLENKHSDCHALLRDNKVDDLSRMYRLFSNIPTGLDLVSSMFKQHATVELTTLVEKAADAASNKKVSELCDKYLAYVNECFKKDALFQKALEEAIKVSCNKCVAGSSNAKLLARFLREVEVRS